MSKAKEQTREPTGRQAPASNTSTQSVTHMSYQLGDMLMMKG